MVSGRGLLHLSVLIETMRREGYELAVGKPEVIIKKINGVDHEPYEFLVVDVPHGQIGPVMELVGARRGEMSKMDVKGAYAHLEFLIPARGLIGLRTRLMSATQGEAIMHHNFHDYRPLKGEIPSRGNGVMVSMARGPAVAFSLDNLQQRGTMFVAAGRRDLRGDDHRRECPQRGHGRQPLQGEEADQHAGLRLGQEHPAQASAPAHARDRAGVHRVRRARRDHPQQDPPPQEGAQRRGAKARRARRGQEGRRVTGFQSGAQAKGHASAVDLEPIRERERFRLP